MYFSSCNSKYLNYAEMVQFILTTQIYKVPIMRSKRTYSVPWGINQTIQIVQILMGNRNDNNTGLRSCVQLNEPFSRIFESTTTNLWCIWCSWINPVLWIRKTPEYLTRVQFEKDRIDPSRKKRINPVLGVTNKRKSFGSGLRRAESDSSGEEIKRYVGQKGRIHNHILVVHMMRLN